VSEPRRAHRTRLFLAPSDVDPDEAQVLIGLTELLFDEWYVAREQRTQRLAQLGLIAADKKQLRQQKRLPAPDGAQVDAAASGR
jgi:hypothetical protein